MHPRTGAIETFENDIEALLAGYTVKLDKPQFKQFLTMNRKQRRAEIARTRDKKRLK